MTGEPELSAARPEGANGDGPADEAERPFALTLAEFIAAKGDAPPALIGTEDDNLFPAFGLALYVAKGGKGKTTSMVDLALHLASGVPWLGFAVPRPLNILFIENEGPREPFRRKLERRLSHWPHLLAGSIHVFDQDWGQARLDEAAFVGRLNAFLDEQAIDLVIGDPLDSLGMEGVGSPEDTRRMVDLFKMAGLFSRTAWLLAHHSRKEKVADAIDEASGAWGGRPDLLLTLEREPNDRAQIGFPKVRYGRRDGFAYLLDYDPDTESFEFVCESSPKAEKEKDKRNLAPEIEGLLRSRGEWLTDREIAAPKVKKGIGAKRSDVRKALDDGIQFVSRTGEDAKALGCRRDSVLWQLVPGLGQVGPLPLFGEQGEELDRVPVPYGTGPGTSSTSLRPEGGTGTGTTSGADHPAPPAAVQATRSSSAAPEGTEQPQVGEGGPEDVMSAEEQADVERIAEKLGEEL